MTSMTSVTVRVPLTIRRRGGRKMIIAPDGVATDARSRKLTNIAVTRGDPALVKALARAFRWKRMLEEGRHATIDELARVEQINPSLVSRVLRLTLLAPDVIEAILDGRQAAALTSARAMEPFPVAWRDQRAELGSRSATCPSVPQPNV